MLRVFMLVPAWGSGLRSSDFAARDRLCTHASMYSVVKCARSANDTDTFLEARLFFLLNYSHVFGCQILPGDGTVKG